MPPRNIPRFEMRKLFGLPLLSAGEGAGAPAPLESEVLVDRTTGAPIPWPVAEQVMALRGPLCRFLRSPSCREAGNRALADPRFVVNWDLYRKTLALRDRP